MATCEQLIIDIQAAVDDYNFFSGEAIRLDGEIARIDGDIAQATTDAGVLDGQLEAIDGEIAEITELARARQLADIDDKLQAVEARRVEILRELFGNADTPPAPEDQRPALIDELNELTAIAEALEIQRTLLADGSLEPTLDGGEQEAVDAKMNERGATETLRDDVLRFRDVELVPLKTATEADRDSADDEANDAGARIAGLQLEALGQGCVLIDSPPDPEDPQDPEDPEDGLEPVE